MKSRSLCRHLRGAQPFANCEPHLESGPFKPHRCPNFFLLVLTASCLEVSISYLTGATLRVNDFRRWQIRTLSCGLIPVGRWWIEREKVLTTLRERIQETSEETFFMSDEENQVKKRATGVDAAPTTTDTTLSEPATEVTTESGTENVHTEAPGDPHVPSLKSTTEGVMAGIRMRRVAVTIPPGTRAGSSLRIEVQGSQIDITVPGGVTAGSKIHVEVPEDTLPSETPQAPPRGASSKVHPL